MEATCLRLPPKNWAENKPGYEVMKNRTKKAYSGKMKFVTRNETIIVAPVKKRVIFGMNVSLSSCTVRTSLKLF